LLSFLSWTSTKVNLTKKLSQTMHRKDLNIKNKVYIIKYKVVHKQLKQTCVYFRIYQYQFLSMFTYKNCKKVVQFVMWNDFPNFLTCIFLYFLPSSLLANSHILRSVMTTHSTSLVSARDNWWTLDFANAFVSPGVNSRGEFVPSHGASRRRLRENKIK
jgi:presenilin-like A22 family membrane protease